MSGSFGGVAVNISDARVDYTPTLRKALFPKYSCRTCKYENGDYACKHHKNGTKKWETMTERDCYEAIDVSAVKKSGGVVDIA